MTTTIERRDAAVAWPDEDYEVRAIGDGMEFEGYAARFNSLSSDLGGFKEMLTEGAFTRSLNAVANGKWDVRMFWSHDTGRPLGSTKSGNVRLSQDSQGLITKATLPDTTDGRDMSRLVRDKIVRSMSFGFTVDDRSKEEYDPTTRIRVLREVRLFEVSPVTGWPAYAETTASVRAMLDAIDWSDVEAVADAFAQQPSDRQDVILRALNKRAPTPLVHEASAKLRERYAARVADAKARGIALPD